MRRSKSSKTGSPRTRNRVVLARLRLGKRAHIRHKSKVTYSRKPKHKKSPDQGA
jgi:hypothetical protein